MTVPRQKLTEPKYGGTALNGHQDLKYDRREYEIIRGFSSPYTLFQNGRHAEENRRELHENEAIRASLPGQ